MGDLQEYLTKSIAALKETAGAYSERLSTIAEKIEKLKADQEEKEEKESHEEKEEKEDNEEKEENEEHEKQDDKRCCKCKIFVDLMKVQEKQDDLDTLHRELLQANRDVMTALANEAKTYAAKYQEMKKDHDKVIELKIAAEKKILQCPTVAFDRKTKHKDVMVTEEGALHNQTSKGKDARDDRELTNVTGAVGNKCFSKTNIAYFGLKADVQIIRTKKIEKARLYDIFDVYLGAQEIIDELRDPGVLYQFNMFGINVWYSNMQQEVYIDILSSTKHVERYTLPHKVKHGGRFEVELGFLVDMPRATIHVLDTRERKLIGSANRLSTAQPMWPAVQIHHCYYEPQYFDTYVSFESRLDGVKTDTEWRKYLLTLVKERAAELAISEGI